MDSAGSDGGAIHPEEALAAMIYYLNALVDIDILSLVSITLTLYDHVLTLQDEWTYIWKSKRPLSGATLIFFANRYVLLAIVGSLGFGFGPFLTKTVSLIKAAMS
ncbi:hypothetical protein BXZ70DRAFT_244367 [Cristinia sonorae]|uniref:DUF6533 domain-containing protein n=1 Tax=Cristinia sonorae TaxID=1940300 RepID=A0A8K0XTX3_9AGAR|nr:hypothetical protein BXZ70DRAFT_244367 [Cristinia sonorae]